MADKAKGTGKAGGDLSRQMKAAGDHDFDFLEKDLSGAYPPGTTFDIDGEKVDVTKVADPFGDGKG